jgi:Spy/CpxP family protein refolding chaperone
MKTFLRAAVAALLLVGGATSASAQLPPEDQARAPRKGGARNPNMPQGPLTNDEVSRAFEAFVVTQAQAVLEMPMGDPQFAEFYRRLTFLQMVQRRYRNQRQRVLMELRRLSGPGAQAPDEAAITAKVKELDDLETQFQAQERQALIAIDLVLQPQQRGRFRIFLENMEQRKVELLMQARRGGPGPGQRPAGQAPIR